VNNLTAIAADRLSSLRSVALVCLTLICTSAFYRLGAAPRPHAEPWHCARLPGNLEHDGLIPVNVQQPAGSVPIGAHLISPRRFYTHHGIYLGDSDVAHYSGFSGSLRSGPIEVIDLEHFAHGRPVWMFQPSHRYSSAEVAERARSRLGENRYRIFSNNCEHFCRWCVSGKSYSAQISACLHHPRELLALIAALEPSLIA